jgi:uncharacterized membrane protein HdeD (DUF308 family)
MFLIFSQDHSVAVGFAVLLFVTATTTAGSILITRLPKSKTTIKDVAGPALVSAVIAVSIFVFEGLQLTASDNKSFLFRSLVAMFALGMAAIEFMLSKNAKIEDRQELRISATLGVLTGLVFAFAPLDDLNAVGFLSAYLAVSAVQRAVWAAGPAKRKK